MSQKQISAVGIDLGTTYSVVAFLDSAGQPQTLANAEGELLTPSLVMIEPSQVLVGKEAVKALATDLDMIALAPKREVGQRAFSKTFHGQKYPPEVLQAWILKKVADDARLKIGDFSKAVVTVPAYFDEVRRKSTQDAGYLAGLKVIDIVNEPTAAALAYGVKQGFLDESGGARQRTRALVYDLGGGTFDVSIVEIEGRNFRTLATDGDYKLGGKDWDQRLVDFCAEEFIRMHGVDPREDEQSNGRLIRDCQEAKESLSTRQQTQLVCTCNQQTVKREVTREQFEEMTIDLVERTSFTTRATLQAAKMDWNEIDQVLLVGGSTRMPMVRELLRELSGKEPNASLSPDEAVAHGAAIRAGILAREAPEPSGPSIKNVNSHSLGVVANDVETKEPRVATIIPRNTPLPVKAKRTFKTHRDEQESILLSIVEGESPNPEHCSAVGRCSIWDLPNAMPAGTAIDVIFAYQENGRLKITVQVGEHAPFQQEIERPNSLTKKQLDKWRKYIAKRQA